MSKIHFLGIERGDYDLSQLRSLSIQLQKQIIEADKENEVKRLTKMHGKGVYQFIEGDCPDLTKLQSNQKVCGTLIPNHYCLITQ